MKDGGVTAGADRSSRRAPRNRWARVSRTKLLASAVVLLLLTGVMAAAGQIPSRESPKPSTQENANAERFATLSFGNAGVQALDVQGQRNEQAPAIGPPDVPPVIVSEYRTPNGWLLRPAGKLVAVPRAPTGVGVSPDGSTIYVINSSIFDEHLAVVDASTLTTTLAPAGDLFMGVVADTAGNIWAAGGNRNKVFQFKAAGPAAVATRHVGLFPGTPDNGIPAAGYPGNVALGPDGTLYVAGNLSVPDAGRRVKCPTGDTICSVVTVVADPTALQPATEQIAVGRDAFGIVVKGTKAYVTNWADETSPARTNSAGTGTVSIVDLVAKREQAVVAVGRHPTGIALSPDGNTLAVANAADDTVSMFSVGADGGLSAQRTVSLKTSADAPIGATPLAVAFTPSNLFVTLAGQNAIAVLTAAGDPLPVAVDIAGRSITSPNTYIPAAWYPSAMAVSPDQRRLYVTSIKGLGSGPGANGQAEPLTGTRTGGTLQTIDLDRDQFGTWTKMVVENNNWAPLFDTALKSAADDPCQPAPLPDGNQARSELLCQIKQGTLDPTQLHAIFIVKENKTFDQYFGDLKATVPGADADPTWLLYGRPVTTNQHQLAEQFTISDQFWADSEQSTTGHQWTSAGYATDYNEITWNPEYSQGLRGNRWGGQYAGQLSGPTSKEVADQEGQVNRPTTRLVDLFASRPDLSVRVYSDDVNPGSPAAAQQVPLDKWGLRPSEVNRGRDLDFPDTDRAEIFLKGKTVSNSWSIDKGQGPPSGATIELSPADRERFTLDAWSAQYQTCVAAGGADAACQKAMPNYVYMALPVDHTVGFNPLMPTPASMVADNDYAVGKIIEALSKSPFWKNTIVFIAEDDTQISGDHVDAHRTFLLTVGGLAKQYGRDGQASHQSGSFPSILKTVEVMFKLPPLTIYDRGAAPLHDVLVNTLGDANNAQYTATRPPTPFLTNPPGTTLAQLSMTLDWSKIDVQDTGLLTALMYAGIRGWPLPQQYLDRLQKGG